MGCSRRSERATVTQRQHGLLVEPLPRLDLRPHLQASWDCSCDSSCSVTLRQLPGGERALSPSRRRLVVGSSPECLGPSGASCPDAFQSAAAPARPLKGGLKRWFPRRAQKSSFLRDRRDLGSWHLFAQRIAGFSLLTAAYTCWLTPQWSPQDRRLLPREARGGSGRGERAVSRRLFSSPDRTVCLGLKTGC